MPIPGCRQERFTTTSFLTFKSFDEYKKRRGTDFVEDGGTNHRVLRGPRGGATGLAVDYPDAGKGWFIDIDTLDELLKLADGHGALILSRVDGAPDIREIEIYDDYRE